MEDSKKKDTKQVDKSKDKTKEKKEMELVSTHKINIINLSY
jgi:hypothetical protein